MRWASTPPPPSRPGRLEEELAPAIAREADWLEAQHQPLLVLGDVPPAAALLAGRLRAPLVWLASFGWDAIHGSDGCGLPGPGSSGIVSSTPGGICCSTVPCPSPWRGECPRCDWV